MQIKEDILPPDTISPQAADASRPSIYQLQLRAEIKKNIPLPTPGVLRK
jgi:hypothetical protein